MMLARCRAALKADVPLSAAAAVYSQNVRWMGRGPTIQGKKNATDAVRQRRTLSAIDKQLTDEGFCIPRRNARLPTPNWRARLWSSPSRWEATRTMWCRLVAAVSKAKAANMPKEKIEAAIKRGVDGKDGRLETLDAEFRFEIDKSCVNAGSNAEAVLYEATGPAGSALMIETLTDNKRRTAPALRHILGKNSGALGTNGSVAWMFERKGYLEIELPSGDGDKPELDEDALMEIALEAGAEDVEMREGLAQVTCDPSELAAVRKGFTEAGLEPAISELIYNPKEFLDLEGEQRETFDKLIDALNEDEDVNQIHHNVNE
ncbi:YebC-like [Phytophthora cactorum]|nr:YebC-like [Phytophthora cactorum]